MQQRIDLEVGDRVLKAMPWSEVCVHMQVADKVMEIQVRVNGVQLFKDGEPFSFPIGWGEAGVYTDSTTNKPYTYDAEKVAA
ncbi:hypothetical protein [Streptomyces sp. NPDC003032]